MGVTARLLKQELLIHVDYGLPFGGVMVRYRGPISEPDVLPEQVIRLLSARIPRDVQHALDELYGAFSRKIPRRRPPPGPGTGSSSRPWPRSSSRTTSAQRPCRSRG